AAPDPGPAPGTGVLDLTDGKGPVARTEPARRWLDLLAAEPFFEPEYAIRSVAARARTVAPGGGAAVSIPTAVGWASVHASVNLHDDDVTVVIQPARPAQVLPILASAHGLTPSEQSVVRLVMKGLTAKQISDSLHVSTDTIHDHLKAVYRKTDVTSQGALLHR